MSSPPPFTRISKRSSKRNSTKRNSTNPNPIKSTKRNNTKRTSKRKRIANNTTNHNYINVMEKLIDNIIKSYNHAIDLCKSHPYSKNTAKDGVVCGIEQVLQQPVSKRLKTTKLQYSEDESEYEMHKTMCGCRLSATVIFVMLILKIKKPVGDRFSKLYNKIFINSNSFITKTIRIGLTNAERERVSESSESFEITTKDSERERVSESSESFEITTNITDGDKIYLVQILKRINSGYGVDFTPHHTFVIVSDGNQCITISSWYSGDREPATPLIQNKIAFNDLQQMLTPDELINPENSQKLFGKKNILTGDIRVVYFSHKI
jgi:hypothetical protein